MVNSIIKKNHERILNRWWVSTYGDHITFVLVTWGFCVYWLYAIKAMKINIPLFKKMREATISNRINVVLISQHDSFQPPKRYRNISITWYFDESVAKTQNDKIKGIEYLMSCHPDICWARFGVRKKSFRDHCLELYPEVVLSTHTS